MRTFVIAEPGSCHDGSLERACQLIIAAGAAGAAAVKFQFWSSAEQLAAQRRAPAYRGIYARYALNPTWLPVLRRTSDQVGVEFMLSVYLRADVEFVSQQARRVKVSSFEADSNLLIDALEHARKRDGEVIVSTGMLPEHRLHSIRIMRDRYWLRWLRILHCTSAYPTPPDQANLAAIERYRLDGLSDHTMHPWTGALAVAAGARIVEAHLKLEDTDPENPDAPHARGPARFFEYVRNIRIAEELLGDGSKRLMPAEAAMLPYRVGDVEA